MVTWRNTPDLSTPLDADHLTAAFAEKTTPADVDAKIATEHTTERAYQGSTYGRVSPAFQGLKAALADATRSTGIQVLGDSTGVGSVTTPLRWPWQFVGLLAPLYPATTFHFRTWDDVNERYPAPTIVQTGTAGDRYLDGSTGTTTRRMDPAVSPYIAGVIDVRMKLSLTDWTPAAQVTVAGKSGADPERGWYVGFNASTGRPMFTYTPTGLGAGLVARTVTVAPTVSDGAITWIRWVFTPNNGAAGNDFAAYQSADGLTWTQLGSTVTTATAATVFNNSTRGFEVGGVASGMAVSARVYEVEIRNGLNGPTVAPRLPDLWPPYDASAATFAGAPICTIVNGSRSGGTIAYLSDVTRQPLITPDYGQAVTVLNDSHNEGTVSGRGWFATYDTWRLGVEAILTGVPTVVMTQNPETSGTPWYREHAKRRMDLLGYARAKNIGVVDTYKLFVDYGANWITDLMGAGDAVHPSTAGSALQAALFLAHFNAS